MTIFDFNQMDIAYIENEQCILAMTNHLAWSDENTPLVLEAIQDKVNSYLEYIISGQIDENYPEAVEYGKVIKVICQYEPNPTGINFYHKMKAILKQQYQIDFLMIV